MANWKFVVENETDGYHPAFTHASIFEVADSQIGTLYQAESTAVTRYFGNGHSEVDLRPEFRKRDEPLSWFGTTPKSFPSMCSDERAYGERRRGAS
jgi:phenylpropionate dioxygenase-like ring-hydroxylating dioxygenase large terminal subunit